MGEIADRRQKTGAGGGGGSGMMTPRYPQYLLIGIMI